MTRGVSPWRALAQSGISLKWEDPRPSGRGVCQPKNVYFEQGEKPKFTKNHTTILIFKTYNKGKTWFVESSGPFFN